MLFYQLLGSNLFTHRNTCAILREAASETYGPRVYLLSYKSSTFICIFTFPIYHKNTKNIILSYLSDRTLVSDREGIDNRLLR